MRWVEGDLVYLATSFVYPRTISSSAWLYDDVCEAGVVRGARTMAGGALHPLLVGTLRVRSLVLRFVGRRLMAVFKGV